MIIEHENRSTYLAPALKPVSTSAPAHGGHRERRYPVDSFEEDEASQDISGERPVTSACDLDLIASVGTSNRSN